MPKGRAASLPAKGSTIAWRGAAVAKARAYMKGVTSWPTTCGQCGKGVTPDQDWVVGHIKARATHPQLTWDPSNWRIEHRKCSDRTGQSVVIAKATIAGARQANRPPAQTSGRNATTGRNRTSDDQDFPSSGGVSQAPPLFTPTYDEASPDEANVALLWYSHDLEKYAWLQDLAAIPGSASPPRYMTPVPHDAVCSYGWEGCEHMPPGGLPVIPWARDRMDTDLRWWQDLSIRRQLEHREDGSLCFRKKVESAPRRAGKSVGLRTSALWRMEHGEALFGEVQTVIHTGSDMAICREIQRAARPWAGAQGWTVAKGMGTEMIETPGGDRWLVRSQEAVYGYDVTLGLGDECWNVKPDTINEGLEPSMLERRNPQMILTSTAHRRATSLMRAELTGALGMHDARVLLLLWGASKDDDPGDPDTWRAASPYWTEERRQMIAAKYEAALAGEEDPEFDDPDPMRGFQAQYLNVWSIAEPRLIGNPLIDAEPWAALLEDVPQRPADSVAVEAWFSDGVAVARAWNLGNGKVVVSVEDLPDLPTAAGYVATLGHRKPVLVGQTLGDNAAWKRAKVRISGVGAASRTSVGELMRALQADTLRHDRTPLLTEQVLGIRTSRGVDGPRIRSTGRLDAVKAAMWAVQEASIKVTRYVGPSRFRRAS